jgi:hypothetical protein
VFCGVVSFKSGLLCRAFFFESGVSDRIVFKIGESPPIVEMKGAESSRGLLGGTDILKC